MELWNFKSIMELWNYGTSDNMSEIICNGEPCLPCKHFNECTLYLPRNEKLEEIQNRIYDIKLLLKETPEDDELIEELRTLRLSEKKKMDHLRRRTKRRLEVEYGD